MTDSTIIHADALDLGPDVFDGFDALIVDPPYSPHVHDNAVSSGTVATGGPHNRDFDFEPLSPELRSKIAEAAASVRRWSAIFSDLEGLHAWRLALEGAGAEYIRAVPWIRWSQPQLSGDRPPSGCELVILAHAQHIGPHGGRKPIAKHWNGPGSLTHLNRRCMRGKEKHPTEKPVDLLLDLVSYLSDPGEAVLDLCAGSGSTAVAAALLGRTCVGVEEKHDWAGRAERRVSGRLTPRDEARASEWAESVLDEAQGVPEPTAADGSDVKTYERAQRRIADALRVVEALG